MVSRHNLGGANPQSILLLNSLHVPILHVYHNVVHPILTKLNLDLQTKRRVSIYFRFNPLPNNSDPTSTTSFSLGNSFFFPSTVASASMVRSKSASSPSIAAQ